MKKPVAHILNTIGLLPMLKSERLRYSKFRLGDIEDYLCYISNPEVMKFIGTGPLEGNNAREKFKVVLDANIVNKHYGFFKANLKSNGDFAGLVKFEMLEKGKVEVGYALLPSYWGQGLATEMMQAMITYGVSLKVNELIGLVHPGNKGSIRVLKKRRFEKFQEGMLESLPTEYYKLVLKKM